MRKTRSVGVTLIELMIPLIIIAILSVVIFVSITASIRDSEESKPTEELSPREEDSIEDTVSDYESQDLRDRLREVYRNEPDYDADILLINPDRDTTPYGVIFDLDRSRR